MALLWILQWVLTAFILYQVIPRLAGFGLRLLLYTFLSQYASLRITSASLLQLSGIQLHTRHAYQLPDAVRYVLTDEQESEQAVGVTGSLSIGKVGLTCFTAGRPLAIVVRDVYLEAQLKPCEPSTTSNSAPADSKPKSSQHDSDSSITLPQAVIWLIHWLTQLVSVSVCNVNVSIATERYSVSVENVGCELNLRAAGSVAADLQSSVHALIQRRINLRLTGGEIRVNSNNSSKRPASFKDATAANRHADHCACGTLEAQSRPVSTSVMVRCSHCSSLQRTPPLLKLLPMTVSAQLAINQLIPASCSSIEMLSDGLQLCVDPYMLLPAAEAMILDADALNRGRQRTLQRKPAVRQVQPPRIVTPMERAAQHQQLLCFVPTDARVSISLISLEVIQRAGAAATLAEKKPIHSVPLLTSAAEAPISTCLVLQLHKLNLVSSTKYRFPPSSQYNHHAAGENCISSIDWTAHVCGPYAAMYHTAASGKAQQATWQMIYTEYCKVSGTSTASHTPIQPPAWQHTKSTQRQGSRTRERQGASPSPIPDEHIGLDHGDTPLSIFHPSEATQPQTLHNMTATIVGMRVNVQPALLAPLSLYACNSVISLKHSIKKFSSLPRHEPLQAARENALPPKPVDLRTQTGQSAQHTEREPVPFKSHVVTANAKVVDTQLAFFHPDATNPIDELASIQLALGSASVRYDNLVAPAHHSTANAGAAGNQPNHIPPRHPAHSPPPGPVRGRSESMPMSPPPTSPTAFNSRSQRPDFERLTSPTPELPQSGGRMLVTLSDALLTLPASKQQPWFVPPQPIEQLQIPGALLSCSTAHIVVDEGSPDVDFTVDGVSIRWNPGGTQAAPHVVGMILNMLPARWLIPRVAYIEDNTEPEPNAPAPLPPKNIHIIVTNTTLDIPYVLEFRSPEDGAQVTKQHQLRNILRTADANDRPLNAGHCLGVNIGPVEASVSESSKQVNVMSYFGDHADLLVMQAKQAWTVTVTGSRCVKEDADFLHIDVFTFSGDDGGPGRCKFFEVFSRGVDGDWTPTVQLGLFKVVKDVVAASINIKHDLYYTIESSTIAPYLNWNVKSVSTSQDPTLQLLANKEAYVQRFRQWFFHDRAPYLRDDFMQVRLNAHDICIRCSIDRHQPVKAELRCGLFSSINVPYQFRFVNTAIDFMGQPLISVADTEMDRDGWRLTPMDEKYTEYQYLLCQYLDFMANIRGVAVEVAANQEINGSAINQVQSVVQAVCSSILQLPRLDTLSRALGGKGYTGGVDEPPPGMTLELTDMSVQIIDRPMESWLQHLHLLWLDERAEQERRRALLKLKLQSLQRSDSVTPDAAPGGEQAPRWSTQLQDEMVHALREYNGRSYVQRVKKLKADQRHNAGLKKGRLMSLGIDSIRLQLSLTGQFGDFYHSEHILACIHTIEGSGAQTVDLGVRGSSYQPTASTMQLPPNTPSQLAVLHEEDNGEILAMHRDDTATDPSIRNRSNTSPNALRMSPHRRASSYSPELRSPNTRAASAHPHSQPRTNFKALTGRYVSATVKGLSVVIRNFPVPLLQISQVDLKTVFTLAQIVPREEVEAIHSRPASPHGTSILATNAMSTKRTGVLLRTALKDPLNSTQPDQLNRRLSEASSTSNQRPSDSLQLESVVDGKANDPSRIHLQPAASSPSVKGESGEWGNVVNLTDQLAPDSSDALVSESDLEQFPYHIYYDLSINCTCVVVGFAPSMLYSFSDLQHTIERLIPPPVEDPTPAVGAAFPTAGYQRTPEPTSDSSSSTGRVTESSDDLNLPAAKPLNYLHLVRTITHGRVALTCQNLAAKLLASHNVNESSKYMHLALDKLSVDFEGTLLKIDLTRLTAIQRPAAAKQPFLLEIPNIDIQTSISWSCRDLQQHAEPSASADSAVPIQRVPSALLHRRRRSNSVDLGILSMSTRSRPGTPSRQLSRGGESQSRRRTSSRPVTPPAVEHKTSQHECGMNVLLSVFLPSNSEAGEEPLSVTLHSGSLAGLLHFAQLYSKMPPLPIPRNGFRPTPSIAALTRSDSQKTEPGATPNAGKIVLSEGVAGPSATSAMTLLLRGIYVERVLIERIRLTVWEGADLGPARGIRLTLDAIYAALEVSHEARMSELPPDQLKGAKFYMAPVPSLVYSIGNAACGIDRLQAQIVYNERWQELSQQLDNSSDDESDSDTEEPVAQRRSLPVRRIFVSYENERMTPGYGWSSKNLLPSDRPAWSDASGTSSTPLESFKLPSSEYAWNGDWQRDFAARRAGEVDEEMWEYANDFSRTFVATRTWYHNVRRRRWTRIARLKSAPQLEERDAQPIYQPRKRTENTHDFILSLASFSVIQKQSCHPLDRQWFVLDSQRFDFKEVTVGHRLDPDNIKSPGLNSIMNGNSSTQTSAGVNSTVADSGASLLAHFNIGEPARAASKPRVEPKSPSSVRPRSPTITLPNVHYQDTSFEEPMGEGQQRMTTRQLAELPHVVAATAFGKPKRQQDTRVQITLHTVNLYDAKVLITLDTKATLSTIADQYTATVMDVLDKGDQYLLRIHDNDKGKVVDGSVRQVSSDSQGSGDHGGHQHLQRSQSDPLGDAPEHPQPVHHHLSLPSPALSPYPTPINSPAGGPVRAPNGMQHDPAHVIAEADAGDAPRQDDKTVRPGNKRTPEGRWLKQDEVSEEVGELFVLNVINPQFNVHSDECNGRILFMVNSLTVYGRMHWKNYLPRNDDQMRRNSNTMSAPNSPSFPSELSSYHGGHAPPPPLTQRVTSTSALMFQRTPSSPNQNMADWNVAKEAALHMHAENPMLVTVRDQLQLHVVFDGIQAFVAPTDIDVDAGIVWYAALTSGVLKPIMQPLSFACNLSYRPALPLFLKPEDVVARDQNRIARTEADDGSDIEQSMNAGPEPSTSVNPLSRETTGYSTATTQPAANTISATTGSSIQPVLKSLQARYAKEVKDLSSREMDKNVNSFDVQLPEITFMMDSYQFALFVDVLKTISAPLPIQTVTESDVDQELNGLPVNELKAQASTLKHKLTALEWEMRHVEWILRGLVEQQRRAAKQNATNGLGNNAIASTDSLTRSVKSVSPSSAAAVTTTNDVLVAASREPAEGFGHWLLSDSTAEKDRDDSHKDIQQRFENLLRDHGRTSGRFLTLLMCIRSKGQKQSNGHLVNVHGRVYIDRVLWSMMAHERPQLNLFVDSISASASAFDDFTADAHLEVRSFGGRVMLDSYQQPNRWEYAWAELVTPYVLDPVAQGWNAKSQMITARLMKRQHEETIVIQHLDISLFPLNVRLTGDVVAIFWAYFVSDQRGIGDNKYKKYKSKFVPQASIAASERRNNDSLGSSDVNENEAAEFRKAYDPKNPFRLLGTPQKHRPHSYSQSVVQAIKHKRYLSVAKELYRKARGMDEADGEGSTPTSRDTSPRGSPERSLNGPPDSQQDNNSGDRQPHRSSRAVDDAMDPVSRTNRSSVSRVSVDYTGNLTLDNLIEGTDNEGSTEESDRDRQRRATAAQRKKKKRMQHRSEPEPIIMFMYVRFNRSQLLVSYRGNKQHNIENFEGLPVRIRQFVVQRKRWPPSKMVNRIKNEYIKIVLGQLGSSVGSYIAYKMGIRTQEQKRAEAMAKLTTNASLYTTADDDTDDVMTDEMQPNSPLSVAGSTASTTSMRGGSMASLHNPLTSPPSRQSLVSNRSSLLQSPTGSSATLNGGTPGSNGVNPVRNMSMLFGKKETTKRVSSDRHSIAGESPSLPSSAVASPVQPHAAPRLSTGNGSQMAPAMQISSFANHSSRASAPSSAASPNTPAYAITTSTPQALLRQPTPPKIPPRPVVQLPTPTQSSTHAATASRPISSEQDSGMEEMTPELFEFLRSSNSTPPTQTRSAPANHK